MLTLLSQTNTSTNDTTSSFCTLRESGTSTIDRVVAWGMVYSSPVGSASPDANVRETLRTLIVPDVYTFKYDPAHRSVLTFTTLDYARLCRIFRLPTSKVLVLRLNRHVISYDAPDDKRRVIITGTDIPRAIEDDGSILAYYSEGSGPGVPRLGQYARVRVTGPSPRVRQLTQRCLNILDHLPNDHILIPNGI